MCYITTIHSKSQRITTTMTSLTPAQAQAPLIAPPAQSTICSPPQTYTTIEMYELNYRNTHFFTE